MTAFRMLVAIANVTVPRADQGNIMAWQGPDAHPVDLQDRAPHWYRAVMHGACVRLDFGGRLEAGSQILSRAGVCAIKMLVTAAGPPAKR